jgi:mono/diheme cytochrome c family protein
MNRLLWLAWLLMMLAAGILQASEYTFSNGWWWKDGHAFSRSAVQTLDARGCLVTSYRYAPYVAPAAAVTPETADWRSKLLEIAEAQKRSEAKLRQSAIEHQEYMEALKALGLNGSQTGYTTTQSLDAYGYSQRTAPQGATVFGYNEIADVYGNVDLGELYQSAIRLAEGSNRYGSEATNGAMKLVDQFGDRAQGLLSQQLAIAEINAKTAGVTNAARALGDAIKAESRLHIEKRTEGPGPPKPTPHHGGSPILDEPNAKAAANESYDNLTALVNSKCVSCHGGKTNEAGLNLTDLGKLDDSAVAKILARVTSANSEKRMPPGKPLETEELRLFFEASK